MEQIDVPCAPCLPPVAGAKRVALLVLCLLAMPGRVRGSPLLSFPICLDFRLMSRKILIHAWHNTALISAADARCCRNTKK